MKKIMKLNGKRFIAWILNISMIVTCLTVIHINNAYTSAENSGEYKFKAVATREKNTIAL